MPIPEGVFLLEPYLPRGGIVVLYGLPTLGKTAIVWSMAQAVQTGQPWLGLPTVQSNVLLVNLDMPMNLVQNRWQDAEPPFEPTFSAFFDDMSVDCTQFLSNYPDERHRIIQDKLEEMHSRHRFGLVCVDALREVVLGDINISGTPRLVYNAFKRVFPGATILFVHHERKSNVQYGGGDPLQSAAGSMEFMNIAQVAVQFAKKNKFTFLEHLKTQASAQFDSLPISIGEDGVHIVHRDQDKLDKVVHFMRGVDKSMPKRQIDKDMGKFLGMSDRSARVLRKAYEQRYASEGGVK